MNISTNDYLPMPAQRVGGELVKVLQDLPAYTDARHPLTQQRQYALATLVEQNPQLNNEPSLSLLVDAFSYHDAASKEFRELIGRFGIDRVYIALELLYQIGLRSRGDNRDENRAKRSRPRMVASLCELQVRLAANDIDIDSEEALWEWVQSLGGLEAATDASDADIAKVRYEL